MCAICWTQSNNYLVGIRSCSFHSEMPPQPFYDKTSNRNTRDWWSSSSVWPSPIQEWEGYYEAEASTINGRRFHNYNLSSILELVASVTSINTNCFVLPFVALWSLLILLTNKNHPDINTVCTMRWPSSPDSRRTHSFARTLWCACDILWCGAVRGHLWRCTRIIIYYTLLCNMYVLCSIILLGLNAFIFTRRIDKDDKKRDTPGENNFLDVVWCMPLCPLHFLISSKEWICGGIRRDMNFGSVCCWGIIGNDCCMIASWLGSLGQVGGGIWLRFFFLRATINFDNRTMSGK